MSIKRVASRYAKSLLDLAIERGSLEQVLGDMQSLQIATKNRDLLNLVKSPIVSADKKKAVFNAIFGGKFADITSGFINLALNKGREDLLPEIAAEFIEQYNAFKGITSVTIKTATPLDAAALSDIKSKLLASTITAQDLEVTTVVDPSLIGGFVIEVGDKLIDNSVAYQLKKLTKEFQGTEYNKAF